MYFTPTAASMSPVVAAWRPASPRLCDRGAAEDDQREQQNGQHRPPAVPEVAVRRDREVGYDVEEAARSEHGGADTAVASEEPGKGRKHLHQREVYPCP